MAEAASAGRSRAQKRVMWSFDADTSTWTSGWNVGAQTFESWAWESLARGGICGASAESAVYDAGEVEAPGDDDEVGFFGGVPVGEIPVEDRLFGATRDDDRVHRLPRQECRRQSVNDASGLGP